MGWYNLVSLQKKKLTLGRYYYTRHEMIQVKIMYDPKRAVLLK